MNFLIASHLIISSTLSLEAPPSRHTCVAQIQSMGDSRLSEISDDLAVVQIRKGELSMPVTNGEWSQELKKVHDAWIEYIKKRSGDSSGGYKSIALRKVEQRLWALRRQFQSDGYVTSWIRAVITTSKLHGYLQQIYALDEVPYLFLPQESGAAFGIKLILPTEIHRRVFVALELRDRGMYWKLQIKNIRYINRHVAD